MNTSIRVKNITTKLTTLSDPWQGGLLFVSLIIGLPVIVIFASLIDPQWVLWQHLAETVLADYVVNTLILACSVGVGSLLIGTALAWVISRYQFYMRNLVQWLVLLPLAMPAYIIAYTYTGLLDFTGPLQAGLREWFGWSYGDYWFPEVRSLSGAIIMMVLVLYPYVYMLARTAFSEQSVSLQEASRSMGISQRKYFFKVALPLARPAIITGTALAMMEAFADYGTVQYFGVNTFTTGIFRTWFGLGNSIAATQLAAMLCSVVLILLVTEKWSRRKIRYFYQGQKQQHAALKPLSAKKAWLMLVLCLIPPLLGFFIPVGQLLMWAIITAEQNLDAGFVDLLLNSFLLASFAAILVVALALLFAYGKRLNHSRLMSVQVQVASMGYAIPGTVIAVGILLPLSWADKGINALLSELFNYTPGLILSGTAFALLLAYAVRFLSVALHNVDSGLARVTPNMDSAARSLGLKPLQVLTQIHVPLLRGSVISAMLLVFVDVLKELPATLILRPFNFNTLAVRSYEMASDERLMDAALPAVAIVAVGLIPVILLTRALDKSIYKVNNQ